MSYSIKVWLQTVNLMWKKEAGLGDSQSERYWPCKVPTASPTGWLDCSVFPVAKQALWQKNKCPKCRVKMKNRRGRFLGFFFNKCYVKKIVSRQRQGEKWLKELLCLPVTETGVCQRTALTNWKKQKNRTLPPGNCCCREERRKKQKTKQTIKKYQEALRMDGREKKQQEVKRYEHKSIIKCSRGGPRHNISVALLH